MGNILCLSFLAACGWLSLSGPFPSWPCASAQGKPAPAKPPDPRALFEQLSKDLRTGRSEERREAVRKLVQLGTEQAWELVIASLADPESAVADRAQLDLPLLGSERLWRELLGRQGLESKAARVRWRTAQLLGPADRAVDAELLARALDAKDGEFSRRLCTSIEVLAQNGLLRGKLDPLERALLALARSPGKDPALAASALAAYARFAPPELEHETSRAFELGSAPVRLAALEIGVRLCWARSLDWSRRLAAERDPCTRSAAVRALGEIASRPAVEILLERLEADDSLWVRSAALDQLQDLSGLKYRLDPRPWKDWLANLAPDWRAPVSSPAAAREAPQRAAPGATTTGGLMGLSIDSERVCFLFDLSGSMAQELEGGGTPKSIVGENLRSALSSLHANVHFNLIPFSSAPIPWKERLVPANSSHVKNALEFFGSCQAGGRGNFYDAFTLAWSDPLTDRLIVLTDGVPTGGLHSDMDVIAPLVLARTRFRPVVLDAVLVDASPASVRRWRALAEKTGGRAIEVGIKKPSAPAR